jgi:aspartate racemase
MIYFINNFYASCLRKENRIFMKPKSIGIIGGAGPLAGAFLLEKVLSLSNRTYGCCKDSDYPQIFFISFPFSEMLSPMINTDELRNELSECLNQLRKNGASVLAIACNTLHAFLDGKDDLNDFIHLPRELAKKIPLTEKPLVLCTSTSVQFGLHKQFFSCIYPDFQTQKQVDDIIEQILQGRDKKIVLRRLEKLLQEQTAKTLVLGCTELSLFAAHLSITDKLIIDPLEVIAKKILEKSFLN